MISDTQLLVLMPRYSTTKETSDFDSFCNSEKSHECKACKWCFTMTYFLQYYAEELVAAIREDVRVASNLLDNAPYSEQRSVSIPFRSLFSLKS